MKLGSLFDGIGGFPLAATRNGITPVWASEIEPGPMAITKKHFPDMVHLGDVTKIDGAAVEPVDVITFGSPCQDLSVAGKRAGLDGARSGLFMEAIRIIKEMRNATGLRDTDDVGAKCGGGNTAATTGGGTRDKFRGNSGGDNDAKPRFAVWENVPGAFSSNSGEDFRVVLEELCRVKDPTFTVPSSKWEPAGLVEGDGWSVAWRVLDAQYWGVPQRRKRIFLVADFGGSSAGQILFERESLRGDSAKGAGERQGIAADAKNGAGAAVFNESGRGFVKEGIGPIRCVPQSQYDNTVVSFHGSQDPDVSGSVTHPLGTNQGREACICITGDKTHCLKGEGFDGSEDGTGRGQPIVAVPASRINCEANGIAGSMSAKWAKGTGGPAGDEHYNLIAVPMTLAIRGRGETTNLEYRQDGTANAILTPNGGRAGIGVGAVAIQHSIIGRKPEAGAQGAGYRQDDKMFTLDSRGSAHCVAAAYRVRRLTPTECERLQGFPDGWTDGFPDTVRYKALGNSVAVPCVEFVMEGIAMSWLM